MISIITTLFLTIIDMHIRQTRFLETIISEVVFYIDEKILEKLVIIEKMYAKIIFSRCIGLDKGDDYNIKATCIANHKDNMIEVEEENLKAKAKQLKNKK